ncbi:MAG TPA: NINE protein [Fimbriimonas sp.]
MYSVVGADGQVYGPANMATLEQWIKEGRITPSTNLIDPIDGRVYRAQDLPLVAPLLQSVPPVAVPQPPRPSPFSTPVFQNPIQAYPHTNPALQTSDRSKLVAILLALFLGSLGIHRFYLGHNGSGTAMLLITLVTCGFGGIITGIWALIDIISIATDSLRDVNGRRLA